MIPFQDLSRQFAAIATETFDAMKGVLEESRFILGPQVEAFEADFARYLGTGSAIGVGSGTDAIVLALHSLDIGPGDEVITTPFTAVPTAMAVLLAGARPVFADIEKEGYGLEPEEARRAGSGATRAILPVHIFGESVDLSGFGELAGERRWELVEDACQAHGARFAGTRVGTIGAIGCFSFYPTKNLGAFGDGGMVVTNRELLAERLRRLRDYGRTGRDVFEEKGWNSRLDELHAAALRVRLARLEEGNEERRRLARLYSSEMEGLPLQLPLEKDQRGHVYHLFVVRAQERDELQQWLAQRGVGTHVHYPQPVHLQPAFAHLGYGPGDFPRAEAASAQVLSLPLFPGLSDGEVREVAAHIRAFYER
ncbi:MAG: DegT/DnrJ/EryC1/StrS family aminotransferase [Candidatus Geothermincolia bacterium]